MNDFDKKRKEIVEAIDFGAFHRIELEKDETLFHYTSLEGLRGIVTSEKFWATEYHFLNDEDEFSYADKLLLEVLEKELSGQKFFALLRRAIVENQKVYREKERELHNGYYVVSFSKKPDNLTLWAEFASFGCNVEIEPIYLFGGYDNLAYHGKVYYKKEEQEQILRESLRWILEEFTEKRYSDGEPLHLYFNELKDAEIALIAELFVRIAAYYGMAMKDEVYETEDEYRFIFASKGYKIDFRIKGNIMIPYIELKLEKENMFEAIRSITLAPLNGNEMCEYSVRKFLKERCNREYEIHKSRAKLRY